MAQEPGTPPGLSGRKAWLVMNAASGSNDERSQAQLQEALIAAGVDLARVICFPDEEAPTIPALEAADVDLVVTFGGDGTTHAVVTGLFGWSGAALVLPGGTMNLLAKALHGERPAPEIIADLVGTKGRRVRPPVIATRHGIALTGVLAGPGAIWNEVREAMRAANLLEVVAATRQAISHTTAAPRVMCEEVDAAREDGYAAITVNPVPTGLDTKGYYAETLGDFAGQGIALINRNFRNGPHDLLGTHARVALVCREGDRMGLLIDGEPFDGAAREEFHLAQCGVDLIASAGNP